MKELLLSNDAVLISFVGALLKDAGIVFMVADQNMSAVEGSLGILPRRLLVKSDDFTAARRLLTDADLGHVLRAAD